MVATVTNARLEEYQLKLPSFEGPFDVLLRLIEREQLEISEVSIVAVFDQFMSHMVLLNAPPPTLIAEFAAVAGRLSVLKSRALLPKPPRPIDDADEPDLVRQLAEYRAVKAAAELLADRQQQGSGAFSRGESVAWPAADPPSLVPHPPAALAHAVRRWLARIPERPIVVSTRPIVSLRDMISRIVSALSPGRSVSFDTIRAGCATRQDVAVAFLALLVLLRRDAIHASQPELFGSIVLTPSVTPPALPVMSGPPAQRDSPRVT